MSHIETQRFFHLFQIYANSAPDICTNTRSEDSGRPVGVAAIF